MNSCTYPTCDISLGWLTLPVPEAEDLVELILLHIHWQYWLTSKSWQHYMLSESQYPIFWGAEIFHYKVTVLLTSTLYPTALQKLHMHLFWYPLTNPALHMMLMSMTPLVHCIFQPSQIPGLDRANVSASEHNGWCMLSSNSFWTKFISPRQHLLISADPSKLVSLGAQQPCHHPKHFVTCTAGHLESVSCHFAWIMATILNLLPLKAIFSFGKRN